MGPGYTLNPEPLATGCGLGAQLGYVRGLGCVVLLKYIEYGVYGDLIILYPKPYSIYLRGTIGFRVSTCNFIVKTFGLRL